METFISNNCRFILLLKIENLESVEIKNVLFEENTNLKVYVLAKNNSRIYTLK